MVECKHDNVKVRIWIMHETSFGIKDGKYEVEVDEQEQTDWNTATYVCHDCGEEISKDEFMERY